MSVFCLVIGCGKDVPTSPPEPTATTLIVAPSPVTLHALSDTTRFTVTVRDQNGQVMAGALVAYSSSDRAVATVDGSGLVTAVGNGVATVTATSGTASGVATVIVEQRVAEVRVSPDSLTLLAIGDTLQLAARGLDANGQAVVSAEFVWSSDRSVATVGRTGVVTAVQNGSALVTATSGTVSGSATVTVEQRVVEVRVSPDPVTLFAIGNTVRLEATGRDANGHAAANAEFVWSSDGSVARVDAYGTVTAVGEGNGIVTATSGSASGSATVTVTVLGGPGKDRAILEALYEATGGPLWRNNDNWLTFAPLDDWYGVDTDPQGRVVELRLIANNLEGQLPPELGRLDELRHLRLDAALTFATACSRPFLPPESTARSGGGSAWPRSAGAAGNHFSSSWVRHSVEGRTHGVDLVADAPGRARVSSATRRPGGGNRLVGGAFRPNSAT